MSFRLLSAVLTNWDDLDGYAVSHGMPELGELPLYRLCNFAYSRFTAGGDEKHLERFRARLWMPPKGEAPDARSPWSAENESKGFAALSAQIGKTKSVEPKRA